jgi:preprotein translocase subunit SecA
VQGLYPQRSDSAAAWLAGPWARLRACLPLPREWLPRPASRPLQRVRASQAAWARFSEHNLPLHLHRLRARLGRDGWHGDELRTQALGCAAALMQRTLGRNPYDSQLLCAQWLLEGRLAEMATGEGKTLAVALAAAVAALAGVPVHLMTANDYLAARDARQLRPFFRALGLCSGAVLASSTPEQRRLAYACDITHCTAREVAFDHLRDRQQLQAAPSDLQQRAERLAGGEGAAPALLLRGLCMALVDEADSLLIDEATMPLVLAEAVHDPRHRAWCFQALALARALVPGTDADVDAVTHHVSWTAAGQAHLQARAAALGGAWHSSRHRLELVGTALVALHALRRDEHYLVRDGKVELLDPHTGRAAQGRVWSRGLHTLVELKEGCTPSPHTRTSAQTSYQRFFARYLHLAGTSGTLAECRRELAAIYGLRVLRVPLRTPCQRTLCPPRLFRRDSDRAAAVVERVRQLQSVGRPVLVGVASVAQAQRVGEQLSAAGIAHQVLDARHDAGEAAVVGSAGQMGSVTVATAMAGRGTDISLGPGVVQAGGLHVIVCQDNRCARLDRQFIGRCARQGDPGSAELWHARDAGDGSRPAAAGRKQEAWASAWAWARSWSPPPTQAAAALTAAPTPAPVLWLQARQAWLQHLHESQAMKRRRRLLEQELSWEKQLRFTHLHA